MYFLLRVLKVLKIKAYLVDAHDDNEILVYFQGAVFQVFLRFPKLIMRKWRILTETFLQKIRITNIWPLHQSTEHQLSTLN